MMLLTIIAPPKMEESLVDWLLVQTDIKGFTSQVAYGHGSGHEMSLAEQVSGRRRQVTFMIELEKIRAESILVDLKQHFLGTGLYYWLVPISVSGSV